MGRRTYREVDGERVEGTWRHIFTRNMDMYFLTDMIIYADGAIDCGTGGLTDLDGLRELLRCGRVAVTLTEGGRASAHHVASWRFLEPQTWVDAENLVGEAADEIDRLNGRPDSIGRCLQAVNDYLADMSESNRLAVRERYLAIPKHLRVYALGDMDHKDGPLRALITGIGAPLHGDPNGRIVTAETHANAIEYFRERDLAVARWEAQVPADGPERSQAATVTIPQTVYPKGWPETPGIEVLQNDYPTAINVRGRSYPTVTHAYWALSSSDPESRDRIAAAERGFDAKKLAENAPRHDGWPAARLAVMAELLRAKYTQNMLAAETLRATGDARLIYVSFDSAYWASGGKRGTNWIGRLLEVVRSELVAVELGLSAAATS